MIIRNNSVSAIGGLNECLCLFDEVVRARDHRSISVSGNTSLSQCQGIQGYLSVREYKGISVSGITGLSQCQG
jgi:hypothetical protein